MVFELVSSFLIACLLSGVLTAAMCRVGPRIGLVDHPDGYRRIHTTTTPLGGGLAIFLAMWGVLGGSLLVPSWTQNVLREGGTKLFALLAGGAAIVAVGLLDDRFGLRGRQKLLGQTVAASILIAGGLIIREVDIFGWHFALGLLSVPVTLFWLLGAVNSLNLLDGIDGLVSTIGFIIVATVAVMAMKTGPADVVVLAVVLAGSLLGFLAFNFPPAKIFLGDTGSMLIGLMIGALAITGAFKSAGTVLLAAPLALWTIPILDCGTAILRRKLTGRSIYVVDHGHLHHRMLARLGSSAKVVTWIAVACAATCAAGLLSVLLKSDLVALLTCTAVVTVFIAGNVFGRMEALLLLTRLRNVGASLVRPAFHNGDSHTNVATRLQGSHDWGPFWETVTQAAETIKLDEVALDVHLPVAGESFSASLCPRCRDMPECRWKLHVPLFAGGQVVGQLFLAGRCHMESTDADIERALLIVEQVQEKVPSLCGFEAVESPSEQDAKLVDSGAE